MPDMLEVSSSETTRDRSQAKRHVDEVDEVGGALVLVGVAGGGGRDRRPGGSGTAQAAGGGRGGGRAGWRSPAARARARSRGAGRGAGDRRRPGAAAAGRRTCCTRAEDVLARRSSSGSGGGGGCPRVGRGEAGEQLIEGHPRRDHADRCAGWAGRTAGSGWRRGPERDVVDGVAVGVLGRLHAVDQRGKAGGRADLVGQQPVAARGPARSGRSCRSGRETPETSGPMVS